MKISVSFPYSLLQTPEDAVRSWLAAHKLHGPRFQGVIFTTSHKNADPYLRAAERHLPPWTKRHRNFSGPVAYELDGSDLYVEVLDRHNDGLRHAAPKLFICLDNPAGWPNTQLTATLVHRLSSAGTHVVAVGSRIVLDACDPAPQSAIDYFAITRSVSN